MFKKVISAIPGFKPKGSGRFFYPRQGYGQISAAYHQAAEKAGANVCLQAQVKSVEIGNDRCLTVSYEKDGSLHELHADQVWSTIPITILARILKPAPPPALLQAAQTIDYRSMILVYLVLEQDRFSEYDAHYFPEEKIAITRLSEPKNYSNRQEPRHLTVLCAELPCSTRSPEWGMSDAELGRLVSDSLNTAGIPITVPVRNVVTKRLSHAYPIYTRGYEDYFNPLDEWVGEIPGLLTFGRQGLFAHDNTHHALYMAYCAAKCVRSDGSFDDQKWLEFRQIFKTHVVED